MKWVHLTSLATLLVAMCHAGTMAHASGPDSLPSLLKDFEVPSDDKAAVQKTLAEIPDTAATATFRGILTRAERAAEAMKNVLETAAEQQRFGTDDRRRRAKDLALAVALGKYEESLDEIAGSLDGAKGAPLRFIVSARAALSLAGVVPLRSKLSPLDGDVGPSIDRATDKLRVILSRLLQDGVALREKVLEEQMRGSSVSDLRVATRKYADTGDRVLQRLEELQRLEFLGDPDLKKCYSWLQSPQGSHPPVAGSVVGLSNANRSPVFAVSDMNALVPWPLALAHNLEIGHTELQWDIAGVDPVDAKPESPNVQPRLNVSFWFVLNDKSGTRLPLHSLRLRGSPVDRFTLGDEAEYRRKLKEYLADKVKDQVVLVDKGDLAAMRAALTASPAKQHFDDFHHRVGLEVGASLGENELTYKLIDSLWTKQLRLNREVFWLVRLPSLRDTAPKIVPAPVPPEPSAKKVVDYSEDWRKILEVPSSTVDPHDVDVSIINELIHRKLNRRIDEHRQATLEKLWKSDEWKAFLLAEEGVLAADQNGKLGVAPIQGALIRSVQEHLSETCMVLATDLRYRLPSWLPPVSRYQPGPYGAGMPSVPQPRACVVELLRAWNASEDVANRGVDPIVVRGWRQFISTLSDLDHSVVGLFGEQSVHSIPDIPSFLKGRRIRGLFRPQVASEWLGDVALDNLLPESVAELRLAEACLDRFDDLLGITEVAVDYILETDVPKTLVDRPDSWQKYCADMRVYSKVQDVKIPAVSGALLEASLARRQILRNGLVKTSQMFLEECKAEQQRTIDTLSLVEKHTQDLVMSRFPDKMYARGESGDVERIRARFKILSGKLAEMAKDVDLLAKASQLPPERLNVYADNERKNSGFAGGVFLRWKSSILENLKDQAVIRGQADMLIQELRKKVDSEASKSVLDARIESSVITRRTFGEILARYGSLREKGLPKEMAMYCAYESFLADGMPLDPAIEVHQGLRLMAAEAGVLIGTPFVATKAAMPQGENDTKP